MRVGIDISKAVGQPDGIATYTLGLLRGLAAVDPEGCYRLYGLLEPVTRVALEARLGTLPAGFEVMGHRRPRRGEVDVFHGTAYALPATEVGASVLTLHDLTFLALPEHHTLANRLHCLRGVVRAAARGARWVAVSASTRGDALRWLALSEDAVDVVPLAAEERFRPVPAAEAAAVLERQGLTSPYLLSVGVLEPRKNLRRLLLAFAAVPASERTGVTLAVAGRVGWLGEDPRSWPEAQALGTSLRFLGEVPGEDLPALYSNATAFAYPSLYEGFGLPALEALACGCPVLTSAVSSLPEVVGEAGVLVDPTSVEAIAAGLARLLGDAQLRAGLRRAGPERAASFSWARMAGAMVEIYRRAASTS